jgi:hypothetical protein
MKTILLEVEDNAYQAILDFIKRLPKNQCSILEENQLSEQEQQHIQHCLNQIHQSDYSEFDDWETVKNHL